MITQCNQTCKLVQGTKKKQDRGSTRPFCFPFVLGQVQRAKKKLGSAEGTEERKGPTDESKADRLGKGE